MIVIATPTREHITAGLTADIVKLCRRHPDARFMAPIGIYLQNLRQQAVIAARAAGASHVLFLDSDMRVPDDIIDRLLSAKSEIVAANYVQRTMREWWVARRDGLSVSSLGRTGLEQVDFVGCGAMLIDVHVFDVLPKPWFPMPYDGQGHVGEDVSFCALAREHGFAIWIDHDLSQRVRHIGTVELGAQTLDMTAVA